jgi:hypothetical protein
MISLDDVIEIGKRTRDIMVIRIWEPEPGRNGKPAKSPPFFKPGTPVFEGGVKSPPFFKPGTPVFHMMEDEDELDKEVSTFQKDEEETMTLDFDYCLLSPKKKIQYGLSLFNYNALKESSDDLSQFLLTNKQKKIFV